MNIPQILYIAAMVIYVLFFLLFLRYFWWKRYAEVNYWKRRPDLSRCMVLRLAEEKGVEVPFIAVLIPARNEADVIGRTIDHMTRMNYPKDRYEIIVITDEKEILARPEGELSPTTQDIVQQKIEELRSRGRGSLLKHVMVPYDFEGRFGGACIEEWVPSTKGRALNYGLSFLDPRAEMCGFFDAESRPDPGVLLYIAYRRLIDGDKARMFQGPVFQVRNFYQMGPLSKIASLYQSITHEWYMPVLMKRLPFVGGTNLFVERALLEQIGGFDHLALTEDLELGARAYLEAGAWPEYLPYSSTEQTPSTYRAFFRQRLRWGTGHLQVVDKFRKENKYPWEKKGPLLRKLFWKGQGEWVFYQSAVMVPLIVLTLSATGQMDNSLVPRVIREGLATTTLVYFAFTFYAFWKYSPYLDSSSRPRTWLGRYAALSQLFCLPVAAFFFPLPYSSALVLRALHKQPQLWIKTPRTRE